MDNFVSSALSPVDVGSSQLRRRLNLDARSLYRFDAVFALSKHMSGELDKIPMEDLLSAFSEENRGPHHKATSLLRCASGIISVTASCILIWKIVRSHKGLSTTQHRLLLGLCIFDILSSLSYSTFNMMVPSEVNYYIWNSRGNEASCAAQGFIVGLGTFGGLFYNTALNLYFLAVVKYKKNDDYIRTKLEPFFHGLPVVVALSYGIGLLIKEHYNDYGDGNCIEVIHYPPHCYGYDVGEVREGFEIPCGRGLEGALIAYYSTMTLMFIPIIIMTISLGMIYRTVRKMEKKISKYGAGAIRANLLQNQPANEKIHTSSHSNRGIWASISSKLSWLSMSTLSSLKRSSNMKPATRTRSNNVQSHGQAVKNKAFAYAFAWLLSYGMWLAGQIIVMMNETGQVPIVLFYMANVFIPLQGLFNLLIFMYPKILSAKKSRGRRGGGENVSWCQAISIAFFSKGAGEKKLNSRMAPPTNLRDKSGRRTGRTARHDDNNEQGRTMQTNQARTKKRFQDYRQREEEEEEKCEIQPPDNIIIQNTRNKSGRLLRPAYVSNNAAPVSQPMNEKYMDPQQITDLARNIKKHHENRLGIKLASTKVKIDLDIENDSKISVASPLNGQLQVEKKVDNLSHLEKKKDIERCDSIPSCQSSEEPDLIDDSSLLKNDPDKYG